MRGHCPSGPNAVEERRDRGPDEVAYRTVSAGRWDQAEVEDILVEGLHSLDILRHELVPSGAIVKSFKLAYTTPFEQAVKGRFEEFVASWGGRYPGDRAAVAQRLGGILCRSWSTMPVIGWVICTTNPTRVDQRLLTAGCLGGRHFPNEQAALKCLYLVTCLLDPASRSRARWMMRWKPAHPITFAGGFERTAH